MINPSTELAYPVNTAIFTMWDAYQPEAKETSRITQNMRTASTQWVREATPSLQYPIHTKIDGTLGWSKRLNATKFH